MPGAGGCARAGLTRWFYTIFPLREQIFELGQVRGTRGGEVGLFGLVGGQIEERLLSLGGLLARDELEVAVADAAPGLFAATLPPEQGSREVGRLLTDVIDEVDAVERVASQRLCAGEV